MSLTLSLYYAALLVLVHLALSIRVVTLRRRLRVGIGDGNSPELARVSRAQANFAEYVPLALVLMVLLEASGCPPAALHTWGAALFVGRVAHGIGLSRASGLSPGRFWGTALTFLVLLTQALAGLWLGLRFLA